MMFKMVSGLLAIQFPPYILFKRRQSTRQFHPKKFIQVSSKTTKYQHSFIARKIRDWNSLPKRKSSQWRLSKWLSCAIFKVIDATFAVAKRNLKKVFDLLSYNSYFTMYYYHYVAVVGRFNYICWNKHPLMPCNCQGKGKG